VKLAYTKYSSNSWIKIDQLEVTCFIISLFNAQHVSNVSTSILRSLRLICWVMSWVVLLCSWCVIVAFCWRMAINSVQPEHVDNRSKTTYRHRCLSEFISKVSCLLWPVWLAGSRRLNALQVPVSCVDEGLGIVLYVLQDRQLRKHIFKSYFILNQSRAVVRSKLTSFNVRILPAPVQRFTYIRRWPGQIYLNPKCLRVNVRITLSNFRFTM